MAAKPTTTKGLRTRGKILDAARAVFARDGFVDARMVEIAEGANVSTGGLYRYFKDKTDVFAALIEDLHEELYRASGQTVAELRDDPKQALAEANRGYIEHYFAHRDVMRAFIEAASVNAQFRAIWWTMRQRHVERFVLALRSMDIVEVDGVSSELISETMACMAEQCCYVWFAHEDMRMEPVDLDDAVEAVTTAWYQATFAGR